MPSVMRLALPVLAAAGSAYAACSAGDSATMTIQNSGDASAVASCKTFSGSIAIQTDAAGPIAIDGIEAIDGSLVARANSNIQQISANKLQAVKTFELDDLSALNQVRFPLLTAVGTLKFNGLPQLQQLGFDAQIDTAETIDIQNTQLQSLQGINIVEAKTIYIANNVFINEIAMALTHVTIGVILEANNPQVNVTFPDLQWAANMTFRNCSSVDIPALNYVNGSLGLYGNYFTSFSAPNLTETGNALAVVSHSELTNISFPRLTKVGATLQVANNSKLVEIASFPQVKTIVGALDFNGNITKIELPQLNEVRGAFNIQSTGVVDEACKGFDQLKKSNKIRGEFVCKGQLVNPGGEGTDPGATQGGKKNAAPRPFNIQGNTLMLGLALAFFL